MIVGDFNQYGGFAKLKRLYLSTARMQKILECKLFIVAYGFLTF
jgi:hypothetical protein